MKVRYTRRALSDLRGITSFIAKENADAAERVRRAILNTIQLVSTRPYVGRRNARAPELRSCLVPRYPYRVHYLPSGDEIVIVHIRHTARRPWEGPREQ
jgi:toxin ParE1/3/4